MHLLFIYSILFSRHFDTKKIDFIFNDKYLFLYKPPNTLCSFDAAPHQQAALARWRQSDGTIDYLGEWHTHPEHSPSPSTIDTGGWRRIWSKRKTPMLFVIAGTQDRLWIGLSTPTGLRSMAEMT